MYALIVEGKNDIKKLKMVLHDNVHYIELNGINFSYEKRDEIEAAISTYEDVFIMTDPDEAGDKVAKRIQDVFPELQRIEVNPHEAKVLKKRGYRYGVEYCNNDYLRCIFSDYLPKQIFSM